MKNDITTIIMRCESTEFKHTNHEIADALWTTINETINESRTRSTIDEWERFYLPAMRHLILKRLAKYCESSSEGWIQVFCNNVREAQDA